MTENTGLEIMLNKGRYFLQEGNNLCGVGVGRTFMYNCFGIKLSNTEFIEKAETGHEFVEETESGDILRSHSILEDGIDEPNWDKIADYYKLKIYKSSQGNIDKLKHLLELELWPIIHRPFELDGDGHYVIVYGINGKVQFFDPESENGGFKEESYEEFYNKWNLGNERWFMIMYDKVKHGNELPCENFINFLYI